ncbi:MAG: YaaC family protein, partial [bacterium]|nr:YaaC family protein [bacterium]
MRSSSHPLGTEEDWQRVVKYAVARVRQAVEFRQAACGSSILTSPLALYYSFLNMTRGFLALRQERLPAPDHGLKYHGDSDLLSNSASLRKGTFQDYLDALGARRHSALRISLEDALSRIIELFPDYSILRKEEDQL